MTKIAKGAQGESRRGSSRLLDLLAGFVFLSLGLGVVLQPPAPALVLRDSWRAFAPSPVAAVPKHVLLSVFLV